MQKFKSKKGFTLAELLIVVAIIAVLTAIAVPLFVGSLNKAEDNVKEANIRAVRSAAVTKILLNEDKDATTPYDLMYVGGTATTGDDGAVNNRAKFWQVTGYVGTNGELRYIYIIPAAATDNKYATAKCEKVSADESGTAPAVGKKGEYKVTLEISETNLTHESAG